MYCAPLTKFVGSQITDAAFGLHELSRIGLGPGKPESIIVRAIVRFNIFNSKV